LGDEAIAADPSLWGELNVHDPAVIKDGGYYYVFSTDASIGNRHPLGVQIRRSRDLVTWEYRGAAFKNFEADCADVIKFAGLNPAKHDGLWAPDIIKINGKYRLYFSASTFGSQQSCIALGEAKKIEGPYTYKGMVLTSGANAPGPNAIDPALVFSQEGGLYLSYGSFFGGIYLAELDRKSGFLKEGAVPIKIAGGNHAALEGSAIAYLPETGYYYLFVSYGSLSRDYNIRVARSRNIAGPYLDAQGRDLNDSSLVRAGKAGTKLMGGYRFLPGRTGDPALRVKAPGHNSVLIDGKDRFILHHVRSYGLPDYWFTMHVRSFALNRFGWPVAAPRRYTGRPRAAPTPPPDGDYRLIEHGDANSSLSPGVLDLHFESGRITGARSGSWRVYGDSRIELLLEGTLYDGVLFDQGFSAMSEDGYTVWVIHQ
jgi:arabinan endo-1,5-alpha-L-arabinosidase